MRKKSVTNTSSMKNNLISSNGHTFKFSFTNNRFNNLKFIELNLIPLVLPNSDKVSVDGMFEVCVRNLNICRYGELKCSFSSTVRLFIALYSNMTWNPTKLNNFSFQLKFMTFFYDLTYTSLFVFMVINSLQTGHRIGENVETGMIRSL